MSEIHSNYSRKWKEQRLCASLFYLGDENLSYDHGLAQPFATGYLKRLLNAVYTEK
jgi:hypothetical protein